jgi:hypothetical protein
VIESEILLSTTKIVDFDQNTGPCAFICGCPSSCPAVSALTCHRFIRNPVRPIARGKFLPPPPEFASCPLEREAWPRNSERPFTNCRSSRPTFSKNIASTNRSIRGFDPPPAYSKRCGAKTGTCRSAATSTRTACAANSGAASRKRRAGEAAISSPPRSPYRPARGCLPGDRRAHRRGAAGDEPALIHAPRLQSAGALGAHTRTRVELSD